MENADANSRIRIEQADGHEAVLAVKNDSHLAGFAVAILLADAVGKQPRMPATHDGFRRGGDPKAKRRFVQLNRHERNCRSHFFLRSGCSMMNSACKLDCPLP